MFIDIVNSSTSNRDVRTEFFIFLIPVFLIYFLIILILVLLNFGGIDFIHHFILRLLLVQRGAIPRHYNAFLTYATNLLIIRRVGGGVLFIHGLVQEHLAKREPATFMQISLTEGTPKQTITFAKLSQIAFRGLTLLTIFLIVAIGIIAGNRVGQLTKSNDPAPLMIDIEPEQLSTEPQLQEVVAASRRIPAGAVLTREDLQQISVPDTNIVVRGQY